MTWREELKNINSIDLLHDQISSSSSQLSVCRRCVNILSQYLQSIRTRRLIRIRKLQIRKVWSNIRLRNQYRFVSACSRNRSILHTNIQMFSAIDRNQNSHSRNSRIYILLSLFNFRFSVFAFTSSRLSHLLWDLKFQSWSVRYLRFNQWISSQCRLIRKNEIVASRRSLKKRKK